MRIEYWWKNVRPMIDLTMYVDFTVLGETYKDLDRKIRERITEFIGGPWENVESWIVHPEVTVRPAPAELPGMWEATVHVRIEAEPSDDNDASGG